MNITGNTILITGGGTGIGRGLAEPLQAVAAANPGIAWALLDVADPASITEFAAKIVQDHPALNVLLNNAGMMQAENLLADPVDLSACEATINANLLGPIRLTAALLPHLRRQRAATVINVTSGLAFVPRADTPTYSATKAAMHSYSQSLRFLLRATPVQVIELAPPLVATDLTPGQRDNPRAMPLADYVSESMALLAADGAAAEIMVERVKLQRGAEARGDHDRVFALINGG